MIKKIYLDMDGVLCDFEKLFLKIYGTDALKNNKKFISSWPEFIHNKNFTKLDWFPGAQELLIFLRSKHVSIEILTSSGGMKYHEEVGNQKKQWLTDHGLNYKANVVPGRRYKKAYAEPNVILIDDTEENVKDFIEAGGIGILYKNVEDTLKRLKKIFDEQ